MFLHCRWEAAEASSAEAKFEQHYVLFTKHAAETGQLVDFAAIESVLKSVLKSDRPAGADQVARTSVVARRAALAASLAGTWTDFSADRVPEEGWSVIMNRDGTWRRSVRPYYIVLARVHSI